MIPLVLEHQRGDAIRTAKAGIRRLERYLQGKAKTLDQATLNNAAERGVADYERMVAAAEACSQQCARGSDRTERR